VDNRYPILVPGARLDLAVDQLEYLLDNHSWISIHLLRVDPIWDPLRDHPKFQALLEKYK